MEAKINFSDEVVKVLEKPIERSAVELIAVGLYRDGKITMRQAADLIGVNVKEMLKVIEKHNSHINYGEKELEEDIAYASGE